jgi:hypothetical protein
MDHRTLAPACRKSRPLLAGLRRCAGSAALAAVAWLGIGGPALAANANFTVTVTPVPGAVSVGRSGLTTYAAYTVSITNVSGNTTNAIRFTASTDVTGDLTATEGDAGALASYVETLQSSACTGGGTSVQCNFAQMQNGANNSFVLIFATPALGAADHWTSAAINLTWTLDYASGNSSSSPSSLYCNGTQASPPPCTATVATSLTTTLNDDILSGLVSYIPSFGGTFFTGNGTSALSFSLAATSQTKLTIPTAQGLTTAQVQQLVALGGLTSATTTTNSTYVTVPDNALFTQFATVELRRDASTISNGAKIANAVVLYSHLAEVTNTTATDFNPLPACPAGGVPTATAPVCIFSRTEFTKKTAPTADDIGDWLFVIHALENGGFKF